jgi:hypothetical protein
LGVVEKRKGLLGINHNRKGGAFEIEQTKVGPKGETSGSERVKGHGEHGVEEGFELYFEGRQVEGAFLSSKL